MDLIYSFDKSRFQLGTLCKRGHAWPGTNQSLRRKHATANSCIGCTCRKNSSWLLSFLDYKAMGWPDNHALGKLCLRKHSWNNLRATLRINGKCVQCDSIRKQSRAQNPGCRACDSARKKEWAEQFKKENPEEWKVRQKKYYHDKIVSGKLRQQKATVRQRLRDQGLTTRGTVPKNASGGLRRGECAYQAAIRKAGRCPSVARLVMQEQRRYWRENPEAKQQHGAQWAQANWWLTYQTRPDLRLYHREKSKRRKAQNRGQTAVQVPVQAIRQRFNQFGNSCAYCGINGDMELEHVVAISQGGAHDIGNIVPACKSCNTSKRSIEMERWYRAQPFFSELRLHRILQMTRPAAGQQLALALA